MTIMDAPIFEPKFMDCPCPSKIPHNTLLETCPAKIFASNKYLKTVLSPRMIQIRSGQERPFYLNTYLGNQEPNPIQYPVASTCYDMLRIKLHKMSINCVEHRTSHVYVPRR